MSTAPSENAFSLEELARRYASLYSQGYDSNIAREVFTQLWQRKQRNQPEIQSFAEETRDLDRRLPHTTESDQLLYARRLMTGIWCKRYSDYVTAAFSFDNAGKVAFFLGLNYSREGRKREEEGNLEAAKHNQEMAYCWFDRSAQLRYSAYHLFRRKSRLEDGAYALAFAGVSFCHGGWYGKGKDLLTQAVALFAALRVPMGAQLKKYVDRFLEPQSSGASNR